MNPLTTGDFTEAEEPFTLFASWLKEAEALEPNDPNAMALATVDEDGLPIGLQLIGARHADALVMRAAHALYESGATSLPAPTGA